MPLNIKFVKIGGVYLDFNILNEIGKIVQNTQMEPKGTRRCMWIHREVTFVRSKGHKFRNSLCEFLQQTRKETLFYSLLNLKPKLISSFAIWTILTSRTYIVSRACAISAIMSSFASSPQEKRIRSGATPAAISSSSFI